jgi:Tol biopolymer transport system component
MEHEVRGTEGSDVKRSKLHHFLLIPIIALTLLVSPALQGKEKKPEPDRVIPGDYDVWSLDWAPDGRIAFCGKQEGEAGTETRIWLYRPEQAKPVLWTGTGSLIDFAPKWAPDGSGVVMVRKTAPTPERQEFATGIWWKEYPSGAGLRLTSGPQDRDPDWSPSGETLVFVRGEGLYNSSLLTIQKNGLGLTTLVANMQGFITTPHWGKDDKIYYTLLRQRKTMVEVAGKRMECWGLDHGSIWVYDLKTGENRPFLDNGDDNRHPVLSPDGRYLAYISTNGQQPVEERVVRDRGSLFVHDLVSGTRFRVSDGVSLNGGPPCWSPDGKRLAFFSFRDNRPAVWSLKWKEHAQAEPTSR